MKTNNAFPFATCLIAASVALLGACSSTPSDNPRLDEAHAAYNSASTNPVVMQQASAEIERAHQMLLQADEHWKKHGNSDETNHLAYVALQDVRIAEQTAASRQADSRVSQAAVEREKIIANARTEEADRARAQANNAQAQASDAKQQAQSANERAAMLQQALADLSAKQTDRGTVVTLNDVLFDVGRSTLRQGGVDTVDKLAKVLQDYPERRVMIEGYTDSTGSASTNQALSESRAEAVKQALVGKGIASDRIETHGYGESKPVADNRTASGRAENRRVEILISNAQGQLSAR